jgi:hypothetical protein
MSEASTKPIVINTKDLSFKSDQLVDDLTRFLVESLPKLKVTREGNEIGIEMPVKLSKRAIRLRIKKFLYKKGIDNDFRPISLKTADKDGYIIKEKKILELTYY